MSLQTPSPYIFFLPPVVSVGKRSHLIRRRDPRPLLLCLSSRLINVVPVDLGINLPSYDRPEQTRLGEPPPRQSPGNRGVPVGRQGEGSSVHLFICGGL